MSVVLLTGSHLMGSISETSATPCSRWWFQPPASGLPPGFLVYPKSLRQRLGHGMVWLFLPKKPSISFSPFAQSELEDALRSR